MKNKKYGFSLAELLIALAIAAIIATIGFTIARKGMERAYDRYIFTGYDAIVEAIEDALIKNNCNRGEPCARLAAPPQGSNNILRDVAITLSGTIERNNPDGGFDIEAPNGIIYNIINEDNPFSNSYDIQILMTTPAANGRRNTVCLSYQPARFGAILLPFRGGSEARCQNALDVDSRRDLIAFYLEDGLRGQVTNEGYQAPVYRTAMEVFCQLYGQNPETITGIIEGYNYNREACTRVLNGNSGIRTKPINDFERVSTRATTLIRYADPAKI